MFMNTDVRINISHNSHTDKVWSFLSWTKKLKPHDYNIFLKVLQNLSSMTFSSMMGKQTLTTQIPETLLPHRPSSLAPDHIFAAWFASVYVLGLFPVVYSRKDIHSFHRKSNFAFSGNFITSSATSYKLRCSPLACVALMLAFQSIEWWSECPPINVCKWP